MKTSRRALAAFSAVDPRPALVGAFLIAAAAAFAQAPPPPPPAAPPPVDETVVVSATQTPEIEAEIPGNVTVVTGDELRRRNVHDLATAIQDVVGMDTGIGSDNGVQVPTVGMWGLKEFDALLFMVDGVPVGGPFNPNLSQINVDDIDRIEIVKGPQGTLYGVSGFAGMVQIFTRGGEKGSHVTLTGGSFSHGRLDASTNVPLGAGSLRLFGSVVRRLAGGRESLASAAASAPRAPRQPQPAYVWLLQRAPSMCASVINTLV